MLVDVTGNFKLFNDSVRATCRDCRRLLLRVLGRSYGHGLGQSLLENRLELWLDRPQLGLGRFAPRLDSSLVAVESAKAVVEDRLIFEPVAVVSGPLLPKNHLGLTE